MTTPTNLFVKSHLYTSVDSSGNKNVEVEGLLAELEAQVSEVIDKIVGAARMQDTPNLTQAEKQAWCRYFYIQWRRVPEVRDQIVAEVAPKEWRSQMSRDFDVTIDVERVVCNAWVESLPNSSRNVHSVLMNRGLGIVVAQNPEYSFIVGSQPMVKFSHPGRAHLSDPSVEYWLPLASDVAVSPSGGRTDRLVVVDQSVVQAINRYISKQSTVIAGCSRKLIWSIAGVDTQT